METTNNSFKEMMEKMRKTKIDRETAMAEEVEKIKAEIAEIEKSISEKEASGETSREKASLNAKLHMLKHRLSIYERRMKRSKKDVK